MGSFLKAVIVALFLFLSLEDTRAGVCSKSFGWVSDPHFDFLNPRQRQVVLKRWAKGRFDRLLIAGDISTSIFLIQDLEQIIKILNREVLVVLGNHDYWGPYSMQQTREFVQEYQSREPRFRYLPTQEPLRLTRDTAVVGIDGWGGGPWPFDLQGTEMRDFRRIPDLTDIDELSLSVLELSQRGVEEVVQKLEQAFEQGMSTVYLVTHVPAFSSSNENDPNFLYVNDSLGKPLLSLMKAHPQHRLHILAGHTHRANELQLLPNLRQSVREAEYRNPSMPQIIELR
jgi:predicted phosphohydrolase